MEPERQLSPWARQQAGNRQSARRGRAPRPSGRSWRRRPSRRPGRSGRPRRPGNRVDPAAPAIDLEGPEVPANRPGRRQPSGRSVEPAIDPALEAQSTVAPAQAIVLARQSTWRGQSSRRGRVPARPSPGGHPGGGRPGRSRAAAIGRAAGMAGGRAGLGRRRLRRRRARRLRWRRRTGGGFGGGAADAAASTAAGIEAAAGIAWRRRRPPAFRFAPQARYRPARAAR